MSNPRIALCVWVAGDFAPTYWATQAMLIVLLLITFTLLPYLTGQLMDALGSSTHYQRTRWAAGLLHLHHSTNSANNNSTVGAGSAHEAVRCLQALLCHVPCCKTCTAAVTGNCKDMIQQVSLFF